LDLPFQVRPQSFDAVELWAVRWHEQNDKPKLLAYIFAQARRVCAVVVGHHVDKLIARHRVLARAQLANLHKKRYEVVLVRVFHERVVEVAREACPNGPHDSCFAEASFWPVCSEPLVRFAPRVRDTKPRVHRCLVEVNKRQILKEDFAQVSHKGEAFKVPIIVFRLFIGESDVRVLDTVADVKIA